MLTNSKANRWAGTGSEYRYQPRQRPFAVPDVVGHLPIRDRTAFRATDGWDDQGRGTGSAFRSAEALDRTAGGRATGQAAGRRTDQGVDGRYGLSKATVYRYLNQEVNSARNPKSA